jgi:hypothetical protein
MIARSPSSRGLLTHDEVMPDRRVKAVVAPLLVGGLTLAALVAGVAVARPELPDPDVVAAGGQPAVLLDHGHDARRGDAIFTLTGSVGYEDAPGCFVLRAPGAVTDPASAGLDYFRRPVVWPLNTRGVRDGARVGVQLPTGERIWAGDNIEAVGTPVTDQGMAPLPASVAGCRSQEYVVLERIQVLPSPVVASEDGDYRVVGAPVLDPGLPWTDSGGTVLSEDRLLVRQGSSQCNWEATTYLGVKSGRPGQTDYDSYVRDPFGVFAAREEGSFDAHARVPLAARPTGWTQQGVALWLSDDAAYLVFGDRTERWSRIDHPNNCA